MPESPFDVEIVVGEVVRAEAFPEARKEYMTKLWIDLGEEHGTVQSAGQHDYHYDPEELVGRQVLCATTLGSVRIAGFTSEVLTVGVPSEDGYPVLVTPDFEVGSEIPLGGVLY
ncbi:tRNA-binding protein [Natronosalvus vescus]|uniref:tRNA-binding protein n=1 Tax=Natronosalvus vescus TaxID=2953881 RepID=UPI002091099C|nr:tRNA-binding protein [Natronosalvus vescus]